jgi:hypothetical protein
MSLKKPSLAFVGRDGLLKDDPIYGTAIGLIMVFFISPGRKPMYL